MESIVIYRVGSLGDTIVALPCFHLVERAFPRARKVLLTNIPVAANATPVESILRGSGLVDEFLLYDSIDLRHPKGLVDLRRKLKSLNATTLIYLASCSPPRDRVFTILRDLTFFRLCGFRSILGAPIRKDLRLLRIESAVGALEREAERLVRCISLGEVDFNDPTVWSLRFNAAETAAAEGVLTPLAGHEFIVAHVGGKLAVKDWGDNNWSATLQHISERRNDLGLLLVGSVDERERNDKLVAHWSGPAINGAGILSPRESGAAMRSAKMFIGHDSGPMHLAASLGIPCVALFGSNINSKPRKWYPFGPNWQQHQIVHNMSGINGIDQGRVMDLIEQILGRGSRQVRN